MAPFLAAVLLRAGFPRHAARILEAVDRFITTWGRRAFVTALVVIGAFMIADGIGYFFGRPIIEM